MAPTFRHGKGANFKLDNASGSLTNFSSGVDDVSISRSVDMAETTTYGDNDKTYIPGLRGATISVSGHFASTYAEILDALLGLSSASLSFEYSPDGSTAAGRHLLLGECWVTGLEYGAPVSGKVNMSFDVLITGAVTSTNH